MNSPGEAGILGGADDPAVTSDDFTTSLTLENGRLVGTVEGLVSSHEECPDGPNTCQTVTEPVSPVAISLPADPRRSLLRDRRLHRHRRAGD